MSVSIPVSWPEAFAFADLVAEFYRRNGRDPEDHEVEAIVAVAKDLTACSKGVH